MLEVGRYQPQKIQSSNPKKSNRATLTRYVSVTFHLSKAV